jgi:hypothetical protein
MRHEGQPCRLHAWACPVIMKTDPEHAAWTCARCGALAIVPVGDRPSAGQQADPRVRARSGEAV